MSTDSLCSGDAKALLGTFGEQKTWGALKALGNSLCRAGHMHGALWAHSLAALQLVADSGLHTSPSPAPATSSPPNDFAVQAHLANLCSLRVNLAHFDYSGAVAQLVQHAWQKKGTQGATKKGAQWTIKKEAQGAIRKGEQKMGKKKQKEAAASARDAASVPAATSENESLAWFSRVPLIPLELHASLPSRDVNLELCKILYNRYLLAVNSLLAPIYFGRYSHCMPHQQLCLDRAGILECAVPAPCPASFIVSCLII